MSKLGDGRTSDLIRRFENLALEKGAPTAPKAAAKRAMASSDVRAQIEDSPSAPLSIAAAQSALSAAIAQAHSPAIAHAHSPARGEGVRRVGPAIDAKAAEASGVSRARASSDVSNASNSVPAESLRTPAVSSQSPALLPNLAPARSRANTMGSSANSDTNFGRRTSKTLLSVLNKRADIDPTLQVSQNSWLAFAERCIDEARASQHAGDAETAYVRYMMACNIFSKKFRKLREGSAVLKEPAYGKLRKDISSWVVDELEKLHKELENKMYVEPEHRDSLEMTSEQLDRLESRFSQMYPEDPMDIAQGGTSSQSPMQMSGGSASSGTRMLAERQSRFDEIDSQVQQNDAIEPKLQPGVAIVTQPHASRRVAMAVSPTLPSIDETADSDLSATTCTPHELHELIEQSRTNPHNRPSILLLDVRPPQEFQRGRINHPHIVNIDPQTLGAKCSSSDVAALIGSEEQRVWFRGLDGFDVVVYVSRAMHSFSDTGSWERAPLEVLNSAVYHCEYKRPLRRPPLFLIGGFEAWVGEVGPERCIWDDQGTQRAKLSTPLQSQVQPQQAHGQIYQTQGQQTQSQQSQALQSQPLQPLQPQHPQPQQQPPIQSQARPQYSAPATDISNMLSYHAPTSALSQAPYTSSVQHPVPALQSYDNGAAPGSVHDFFQQNTAYHPQWAQQTRHRAAYESATQGYNIQATDLHYVQHTPMLPSKPPMLVHEQFVQQPKTVFDNPTYGFTGPVYGRSAEYPAVEPPRAVAVSAHTGDLQQQESAMLMEQRKKRRAPPPVPMPQLPQLPPKPTAYSPPAQQQYQQQHQQQHVAMPPRPQMQAQLQTASPRSSMYMQQPGFYNQPVAAGSDPSLNGRMHAGSTLRNSAYHQQIMQPDPAMAQTAHVPARRLSQLPDSASYGATGLKNFGNTCFMNSVLQCLAGTGPLTRYFMRGEWKKNLVQGSREAEVAVEFARLLETMWRGQYASVSPLGFRAAVAKCSEQFKANEQEDAHEFATFLLDALHESLNHVHPRPPPERELTRDEEQQFEQMSDEQQALMQWTRFTRRNWSIVTSIFQGQIQSRLTCMSCQHTSTTYHTFTELSVPIPAPKASGSALVRKSRVRQSPVNIYECLDAYSETEILDGDNKWQCPRCQTKRKATKRLMIARLPLVLIVHLKRFSTIGHFREKLETNVLVPTQKLYMQNYVIRGSHPSTMYNLYGVANHFGTLSGGHYTASVFNGLRDQWNYFDDTRVSPTPETQVASPAAYLLFFVQTQT
ncbi:ubiquitin-specific protease doa4 [Coemansia sp. RSA 1199]|nr:ubiquitin-specific protease doa4 [Coemansia sp. RSA 1199]